VRPEIRLIVIALIMLLVTKKIADEQSYEREISEHMIPFPEHPRMRIPDEFRDTRILPFSTYIFIVFNLKN